MNTLVRFVALSCLLSPFTWAQTTAKRPMTFADLQAMKRISDPQISPSGKWVMFSVTDVSLEKNTKTNHLWVVPITGGKEEQITFGDGEANGRFSPDGKLISMTTKDQIFEAPWNEKTGTVGKVIQVTNVDGGADGAIWSPDSRRLLFVASVYPECSAVSENGGGWAREDACDKAKNEATEKSPVKAQIFNHLLYRHWNAYTGDKRSHVLVVDSADGRNLRDLTPAGAVGDAETPTFSLGGPLGYAWAPNSKEIAYVTNLDKVPATSTNNDILTLRLDEAGAVAKKVSTSPGSDDGPAYSPDGKWLAWRSQARNGFESDLFRLMIMDRAGGAIKDALPRYTNQQNQVVKDNWVDEFTWASDSKRIAYASPDRGREIVQVIPVVSYTGDALAAWSAVSGELGSLAFTADSTMVAIQMFASQPAEIVTIKNMKSTEQGYDIVTGGTNITQLTHLNNTLIYSLDISKLEPFSFTGAEGTKVEGFIVRPPNFDPTKKYPVKFLMHGGPQTAWGDAWSYRWNWELMAANGYVVIGINRRGSTGYGQKFIDEVSGDWGGRAFTDLMKGLDYAETKYPFIDKSRECALGASYGGFMANWVLTHTDRFKCIVTHDGLYNPQSAFGTTEELWFNEWEFRPMQGAAAGGNAGSSAALRNDSKKGGAGIVEQAKPAYPWDYFDKPAAQDPFRKYSPMEYIKNAHTPTLIVHSQRDYRLDVSEGFQLFTALQILGVPSKMLYFPDEGHWVLKPQNSQLWYETVNDWCDRWTGTNKYASVGAERNPMRQETANRKQPTAHASGSRVHPRAADESNK